MTDARVFVRNVAWNLLGTGLPMVVGFLAIPHLINGIGVVRFGVLSIAWMVVGYFSLFDFGLGRAVTQLVAARLGSGMQREIPALVWTAMVMMIVLGLAGGGLIAAVSPVLVERSLRVPTELQPETLNAFYLLALSVPVVILTTGLRGLLEAHQRFDVVNAVRLPLGVMTYLGPLAVLPFSSSLSALVAVLVLVRCLSLMVYLTLCVRFYPEYRIAGSVDPRLMRQLISFGGWMTVSNLLGPLLLYLGRLMLAVLISAEAVGYFSTPYDVVANLLTVPGVFVAVLFPAFSSLFHSDIAKVRSLYRRSLWIMAAVMLPLAALTFIVAKPGLSWWISAAFASESYRVAQLIAIGVFVNSFGHVSQALIQSAGRPDLTAKVHVAEFVVYLPYLWWLVNRFGVDGAAAAWVIRVTISTIVLSLIARTCLRKPAYVERTGIINEPPEHRRQ